MSQIRYRPWRDAGDWAAIAEVLNEENVADGLEWLKTAGELAATRLPNSEPVSDVLIAEIDARAVGVVITSWAVRDGVLSLDTAGAVRPSARRRGFGSELLRRAQRTLDERTRGVEPERERSFAAWVSDSNAGARALLEGDGYRAIRYGYEMIRRGVDDVPDAPLPAGIEFRRGSLEGAEAILAAEDEAFRDHPGHRDWTDADTASTLEHPEFEPGLWVVAWDGDQIAGVVENWVHDEENQRLGISRGWLQRVSVRRPWRQRGLARALIAESFRVLRERGVDDACLGVDADNPSGALRLYESMGFEQMQSGRLYVRAAPR